MHRLVILTIAACIVTLPLAGQDDHVPSFEDTAAVYEELFEIKEPLTLTLKFDAKQLRSGSGPVEISGRTYVISPCSG